MDRQTNTATAPSRLQHHEATQCLKCGEWYPETLMFLDQTHINIGYHKGTCEGKVVRVITSSEFVQKLYDLLFIDHMAENNADAKCILTCMYANNGGQLWPLELLCELGYSGSELVELFDSGEPVTAFMETASHSSRTGGELLQSIRYANSTATAAVNVSQAMTLPN